MKWTGGLPETACGRGSTVDLSANLRLWLPGVLGALGTRRLLDAPCGDFNWMSKVDLGSIDYIGIDNDEDHLVKGWRTAQRLGLTNVKFGLVDLLSGAPLPKADTVMSRDFLQHLDDEGVAKALDAFRSTGARWLIAKTHRADEADKIVDGMLFRRLDLEPLLGPSLLEIADPPGERQWMGVWPLVRPADAQEGETSGDAQAPQ